MADPGTKLTGYDFYRKIGSPKKIVAPMVDHSELSFRMLTRHYGAQLVYTQMFNANCFVTSDEGRLFTTCAEDRPLIVQVRVRGSSHASLSTVQPLSAKRNLY